MFSTCGGDVRCVRFKWLDDATYCRDTNNEFHLAGFYKHTTVDKTKLAQEDTAACVSEKQPRRSDDEERNKIHGVECELLHCTAQSPRKQELRQIL